MSGKPNNKRYHQSNGWVIDRDERRFPSLSTDNVEEVLIRYKLTPPVGHPRYKQWENGVVQAVTVTEIRNDGDPLGWYIHPGSTTDSIDVAEANSRAAMLHMAANECEILIEREQNKIDDAKEKQEG